MPNPSVSEEGDYNAWDDDAAPDTDSVLELIVTEEVHGERLDKWLAGQLDSVSRSELQRWIEVGAVQVNAGAASIRRAVWPGDIVRVTPQQRPESMAYVAQAGPLSIIFEDEALIVIDKPAGLVVHPAAGNWSGTLLNFLLAHDPGLARVPRAGIVHRLDKDTSGLMVVARTAADQTNLVRQLQARSVQREYLALVHGVPPPAASVRAPIGRHPRERTRMAAFKQDTANTKPAVTHFTVLEQHAARAGEQGALALVQCRLETGRTHQIRVHMQYAGFPLVGDPVYAARTSHDPLPRQALHAWRLGLQHPRQARACQWSTPVPPDYAALLEYWGFANPSLRPTHAS